MTSLIKYSLISNHSLTKPVNREGTLHHTQSRFIAKECFSISIQKVRCSKSISCKIIAKLQRDYIKTPERSHQSSREITSKPLRDYMKTLSD